jgi:hypothetical protein
LLCLLFSDLEVVFLIFGADVNLVQVDDPLLELLVVA